MRALRLRVTGMHVMTRRGGRAPGDRLVAQGLSGRSLLGGSFKDFNLIYVCMYMTICICAEEAGMRAGPL